MLVASKTVNVTAQITARPDKCEKTALLLMALVEPTRKEEGCIIRDLRQSFMQNFLNDELNAEET